MSARHHPSRKRAAKHRREHPKLIIAHGERVRTFPLHPRLLVTFGSVIVLFAMLYFGATAYLLFRDGVVAASTTLQAKVRQSYEDRIAELRSEIDRLASKNMLDRDTVAEKVDRILKQQETLDKRQQMLSKLTEAARRAGFDLPAGATEGNGKRRPPDGDITGSIAPAVEPDATRFAAFGLRGRSDAAATTAVASADRLDVVETTLAAMESDQLALVGTMAERVSQRTSRIEKVLARLGHKIPAAKEAVGGPFVPLPAGSPAAFSTGIDSLKLRLERLAALHRIAAALPLKRPLNGATVTSRFGARLDPFLGRPAMHTGIDFRAPGGFPARAVAAGTVIAAEYSGGYGNMVDVDHGNGVVTRYGHLARITVKTGDTVAAGGVVGRIGSTGRATGPHLHYEIRIDGEPVDPAIYFRAGQEIGAWL